MEQPIPRLPKNAHSVAGHIILNGRENFTPLQINKLVFFSHGWMLGIHGRSLIKEEIEAWKYGPVIPAIYHTFKGYGGESVKADEYFSMSDGNLDCVRDVLNKMFDEKDKEIMDQVIDLYGPLAGARMIAITHAEDSPWSTYYDPDQSYTRIPNRAIESYYKEELKKRVQ